MTGDPLHERWKGMLSRCLNQNRKDYQNYGGRGITICERWLTFENFRDDMGPSYRKGLTLERVDNDGNYEPGNCRWLSRSEQSRNRRAAHAWIFKAEGISTNTSGFRGVVHSRSTGRWIAHICIAGKQRHIGVFDTPQEASAAYQEAAKRRANGEDSLERGGI